MSKKTIDIEKLLSRIRSEAEILDPPQTPTPSKISSLPSFSKKNNHTTSRRLHIHNFLLLPQSTFIEDTYRLIMGRAPDTEGLNYYINLVHLGHSRSEIVFSIAHSQEALDKGFQLTGLQWRGLLCRAGLLLSRFSPDIARSAIKNGRGGKIGKILRALPDSILAFATLPFFITKAPSKYLRHWEKKTTEPLNILKIWIQERRVNEQELRQLNSQLAEKVETILEHIHKITKESQSIKTNIESLSHQLLYTEKNVDWLRYRLILQQLRSPTSSSTIPSLTFDDPALDEFYIAFEDNCRGNETDIRKSLEVYLDYVRSSPISKEHPLLDLGCGRGEWLRLLKQEGIPAKGIDQSVAMVERAKAYDLEVIQSDALAYLFSQPDASLGAVTGFHIIEHLPFPVLFRLFYEVSRVLVPGGIAIFETPNPENVLVGSHTFYHDPTHRNPITPTFITFLAHYHGLANIEILRLHPYPESAKVPGNDPLTERVNGHFCGPQDFALIAKRPESA